MARAVARIELDAFAARVLLAMALEVRDMSNDDGDRGVYFGGIWRLCTAVGLMPDDVSRRRVQRALGRLVDAGLMVRVTRGRPGVHSTYRLTMSPLDTHGKPIRDRE